jgi:hypothetical protein
MKRFEVNYLTALVRILKATLSPERIFLLHKDEIPNRVGNDGRVGNDYEVHDATNEENAAYLI